MEELIKRVNALEDLRADYEKRNSILVSGKKDLERLLELEKRVKEAEDWQIAWFLGRFRDDKALKRIDELESRMNHLNCCGCHCCK